jgi:hypothetical protein
VYPTILESVAADTDAPRAFLKFIDQPLPKSLVKVLFSYFLFFELLACFRLLLLPLFLLLDGSIKAPTRLIDGLGQLGSEFVK